MIKILFYSANPESPASGYWDQAMLSDLLQAPVFKNMDAEGGAIVVLPGAYQKDFIKTINAELSKFSWVLLFITSDEESNFPIENIKHPNIKIYVQYPKQGRHDKFGKLPLGYTSDTRKNLMYTDKTLNVFYSGQNSHKRREMCSKQLHGEVTDLIKNISINDTPGFSQGMKPDEYMANICNAKVAPAPSGPVSADSFRTYEALEAGAVPIVDQISLAGDHDYSAYLFNNETLPFATIKDYPSMYGYCKDLLNNYPAINNEVQAWWIKKKRDLIWQFVADIQKLSRAKHKEQITAVIPVSPIKSHPSVDILEATIESIRYHLPDSEIIITFDGVRKEQEDLRADYNEFIRRALFLCNTKWNAIPMIFKDHTHQVGMAKVALEEVKTPIILYCEQDTPLVTDEPIDWPMLRASLTLTQANIIRFHFEAGIPEPHKYLMIGEPEMNLLKTVQWSQRPHLASTDFYKWVLENNFTKNAKCFIEDKLHSVVQKDYASMGFRGWSIWKLFIYYPDPKNIKRSLNNDGRAGGTKYDETQVF